ncbi:hypothetical protein B0H66DRAFT_599226 [Apodospora peruviana]|uniref:Uncharacterized protein n=1 Tax=Apodospora peruviana TaxID=516989 RepID=A0AAE0MBK4_9PEZI|nr:hypothetical protein B0H66DRAFT_599226 [Apodospora peruviana]
MKLVRKLAPLILTLSTGLRVRHDRHETGPPAVTLKVHNPSPDKPFTVLTWDSPLDPLVFVRGHLHLIHPRTNESYAINPLQVERSVPPSLNDLVTIEPGANVSQYVSLIQPVVDNMAEQVYNQKNWNENTAIVKWDEKNGPPLPVWEGKKEDVLADMQGRKDRWWLRGNQWDWIPVTEKGVEVDVQQIPYTNSSTIGKDNKEPAIPRPARYDGPIWVYPPTTLEHNTTWDGFRPIPKPANNTRPK